MKLPFLQWPQRGSLRNGYALAREFCFPLGCALCKRPLQNGEEAGVGLCADCAGLFNLDLAEARCSVCGKPLISEAAVCIPCRNQTEKPAFDRAVVLYPYMDKWRTVLTAYKFGAHRPLARFFAAKLKEAARAFIQAREEAPLDWVPVPARAGKIKEKGWDQIETLARILERDHDVPVQRVLKRLPSQSQKELNRAKRQENLKGRIVPRSRAPRNVILFDDVYTTGATLSVCAATLKANGAEAVYGMCLFYD